MINNKKSLVKKSRMATNRELFFALKKQNIPHKKQLNETEIYELLIDANKLKDYTELLSHFDDEILNYSKFKRNLKRIEDGEPIQYVIGHVSFLGLDINVNNNVLIPRPETEELVLKVINFIKEKSLEHLRIGDICTGSGCIALALKNEFKNSYVYASDFYEDPIRLVNENKKKLNLEIDVLKGDKFLPYENLGLKLDVLVSNPPYVENIEQIDDIVKSFEPMNAIFSKNGTYFYEEYFKNHTSFMSNKFFMAFEINYDQEEKLKSLISMYFDKENVSYKFEKDLYGKTRYLFVLGGYENESF